MPEIDPFRAVRYSRHPLEKYLAPPFDVISPAQRESYAARDSHNIVNLILPEPQAGEEASASYHRAGAAYRSWLSEGLLTRDAQPALYVLQQGFKSGGKHVVRRGVVARMRLEDVGGRRVLPHERTLPGAKAERLDLLREVHANLSPLFMLYSDEENRVPRLLASVTDQLPAGLFSDQGVDNAFWAVTNPSLCSKVVDLLVPRVLYIADGHARYETSLAYAKEIDALLGGRYPNGAHHFVMVYLCAMEDEGVAIRPSHRLLSGMPGFDAKALVHRAAEMFSIDPLEDPLTSFQNQRSAHQELVMQGLQRPSFALVAGRQSWIFKLRKEADLAKVPGLPALPALRELDVTLLHRLILQELLGLAPEGDSEAGRISYVEDEAEAIRAVESGRAQAAFLLNPTRIDQVKAVAEAGELMPTKSTFFYPKLPSGLFINPLDAEEQVTPLV